VGKDDPFLCTSGEKVGLTPPSENQQVQVIPAVATSPSSLKEARPPPKKARTKNYLPLSARYVQDECCMLIV
jgi:hypothetical protein